MTSAEARKAFIAKYAPLAKVVTAGTKVFPETVLTSAIYESSGEVNGNWFPGESKLAREAKNFFGIKDSSAWKGDTYKIETTEYVRDPLTGTMIKIPQDAVFRAYSTPQQSFEDFVQFLQENPRYASNGVFEASTPQAQFQAIAKAGYGTNPTYAATLTAIYTQLKETIASALKGSAGKQATSFAAIAAGAIALLFIFKPFKK